MLPLGQIILNHGLNFNFYADDTQIYTSTSGATDHGLPVIRMDQPSRFGTHVIFFVGWHKKKKCVSITFILGTQLVSLIYAEAVKWDDFTHPIWLLLNHVRLEKALGEYIHSFIIIIIYIHYYYY